VDRSEGVFLGARAASWVAFRSGLFFRAPNPALIVRDPHDATRRPAYFGLLRWTDAGVATIRDFRHAPYVIEAAEVIDL
jgi:hypothetical protein